MVSQHRYGFFALASLSTVGETDISEMTTESSIKCTGLERESEPVSRRFGGSGLMENWGARQADFRHPGCLMKWMMWWEFHWFLIQWLSQQYLKNALGCPASVLSSSIPCFCPPTYCFGHLVTCSFYRTPGELSQILPLWLGGEHSSRCVIFLSVSTCHYTVQAYALSFLVLITETTSQASPLILSSPFSSPGHDTQNPDTCLDKTLVCMQQKLTLTDHLRKRDLLQGCWVIQRTSGKAMKQCLDGDQATRKTKP